MVSMCCSQDEVGMAIDVDVELVDGHDGNSRLLPKIKPYVVVDINNESAK